MSRSRAASRIGTALAVVCFVLATWPTAQARELTFDERVAAQKAIEQVYWNHRVWPKENPGPKPPLSAVMSDDAIRAKVVGYLKQSNALGTWWQRPVAPEQLQAELDRMAKRSRDPGTLRELYDALGNDPLVIAETLGRQTLADRLIRSWYSSDPRFHAATKAKAEAALAACANLDCMRSMGGEFRSTTWKIRVAGADSGTESRPEGVIVVDPEELKNLREQWARLLRTEAESLPSGRLSGVEETVEACTVMAVRSQRDDEITTWSVTWPKRSFDSWWSVEQPRTASEIAAHDAVYALEAPSTDACTNDTWADTVDEPAARTGHTAVWTGAEMIIWGGAVTNSGGRYNPSTDSWTPTSQGANAPFARSGNSALWTGTVMIVWGGSPSSATGGRYDPGTDTWLPTSTGANTPTARSGNAAVWTGTEMIIWGGGNSNTGARYNPTSDTWTPTSTGTDVPSPRNNPNAVWSGTEMIVYGGTASGGGAFNDGGRYNPSTDTWAAMSSASTSLPLMPVGPAVWTGSEMIIWGSNGGGRYNPSTNAWIRTSEGAGVPSQRSGHTTVWTGTRMIVWGGSSVGIGLTNTGSSYDPSTETWTVIPVVANTPSARQEHTAVWTGTEMIVWGGKTCVSCNPVSSGGRYNPSTNSWIATHVAGAPTRRFRHTAVWTGTEMIVWGGTSSGTYPDIGGRYNLATDSWTPTSLGANHPSGRTGHTAIWTGTEMIVWGAGPTGGRYNPATDTWAAMSLDTSVNPRSDHTAVWTGTEMIVWGGTNGNYINLGARYNPSTDTSTVTSVGPNTPVGRVYHSAVWTGTEMIVWGGYNNSNFYMNSGGRYNPSTDSWSPTSMGTNVPGGRRRHEAIWTGTQMVVWGGEAPVPPTGFANSGGRYDPSSDSWTPTSTASNVPTPRGDPTAVWTGTEMIIWGGSGAGAGNTGARYNPVADVWTPTSTGANVPVPRFSHTAVWTGAQMIIWGGDIAELNPGVFCACPSGRIVYRDADGDGYGIPAVSIPACDGSIPVGYAPNATDCDDANASVHPGATENCNALDDDCDGTPDNGGSMLCNDGDVCTDDACNGVGGCSHTLNSAPCDDGVLCTNNDVCSAGTCAGVVGSPPEIRGVSAAGHTATTLTWTGLGGGTTYDLLTSTLSDLRVQATSGASCLANDVPGASYVDSQPNPVSAEGYYYLVRAQNVCGNGGYGSDSAGVERSPLAPCP